MVKYADFDIPVEGYCTLEEACIYLIFGKKPQPNGRIPKNIANYLISVRDKKYVKALTKVLSALCDPFKSGDITAIKAPTSFRQKRMQKISPKNWKDITVADILNGKSSLASAMVNFEQLQATFPNKQFTVIFEDGGQICISDGKKNNTIAKTRPGYKKYEWVKFYFEHENQTITKKDMISHFKGHLNEFKKDDEMNEYVFDIFKDYIPVMHRCFSTLSTTEICCTPTFNSTEALVF